MYVVTQKLWSKDEEGVLKMLFWGGNTVDDMSDKLERSKGSITAKLSRLGLKNRNDWTREERDFLTDNYDKMTYIELANKLGRSPQSTSGQIQYLGLIKYKNLAPHFKTTKRKWWEAPKKRNK